MSESTRMMLGLAIGIIVMIVLVMKTKIHTFIALLLAALLTGLIGGMPVVDLTDAAGVTTTGVITAIKDGFGSTLKSTGIIIGLGVMMGGILEVSGAAEQLAFTFIKAIGKKKEEWALAITGWVVSLPVFADSAMRYFCTTGKSNVFRKPGKTVVGLALSLGVRTSAYTLPGTTDTGTAYSSRTSRSRCRTDDHDRNCNLDSNASCDRTILQMGRKEDLSDSDWRRRI